jgi:ribosomal protein L32
MTAEEFFRKRLIEMTDSETMKKIYRVVNLDKQAQICEEYHQKQLELTAVVQVCENCKTPTIKGNLCYPCKVDPDLSNE